MLPHLTVRSGTLADFDHLARFHYRAARPATCVRIVAADDRAESRVGARAVAVLLVSMPAMNGPWREAVWPGRYRPIQPTPEARRECLRALNAEVRVISRVIVEPRYRGRGIGAELVRAYLRDPLTIHTESIAAMGRFCPLFESAGMRPIECSPARRTRYLRRLLRQLGIEPWRLTDPQALLGQLSPPRRTRLLSALRTFAADHRDTRSHAAAPPADLVALAARRIACEPIAYVHSTQWPPATGSARSAATPAATRENTLSRPSIAENAHAA